MPVNDAIMDAIGTKPGDMVTVETDYAYHEKMFAGRRGVTFKCGKCSSAFCAGRNDIGGYRITRESTVSLGFNLRFRDTSTFHVICARCPSCNELVIVRAEDPSEFI